MTTATATATGAATLLGAGLTTPPHAGETPAPQAPPIARRRKRVAAGCLKALAMLLKNPVTSSPLPRLQVSPVRPTGSLTVFDRASGERFSIYTPAFQSLLDGGHRAGLWYARPVNSVGASPLSRGFATAKEAVEALTQGRWQVVETKPQTAPAFRLRIIWSPSTSPSR